MEILRLEMKYTPPLHALLRHMFDLRTALI